MPAPRCAIGGERGHPRDDKVGRHATAAHVRLGHSAATLVPRSRLQTYGSTVDSITFRLAKRPTGPSIEIEIDGRPLQELARSVELPYAQAEGSPSIAGGYEGLGPDQINRDSAHFLGLPVATWFEDGDTVLLGCECGEWGCWPLTAFVTVSDAEVSWSRFRTGHRDWDLSTLGPFRFHRAEYEASLAQVLPLEPTPEN